MSAARKALAAHRDRNATELNKLLDERRRELFDARMKANTDQERSPAALMAIRRDIARILTVLRSRVQS